MQYTKLVTVNKEMLTINMQMWLELHTVNAVNALLESGLKNARSQMNI